MEEKKLNKLNRSVRADKGKSRIRENRLISDFYEAYKDEFPELTRREIIQICRAPWLQLRQIMSSGELKDIRYTGLGLFLVKPARVVNWLKINKRRLDNGDIPQKFYDEKVNNLIGKIKRHPETFMKYQEKLAPWIDVENALEIKEAEIKRLADEKAQRKANREARKKLKENKTNT